MKGNVHHVILEYGQCVALRCKTHIHFVASKMDAYLHFPTKSTVKAILSSIFQNVRSITYNKGGKSETDFSLRLDDI